MVIVLVGYKFCVSSLPPRNPSSLPDCNQAMTRSGGASRGEMTCNVRGTKVHQMQLQLHGSLFFNQNWHNGNSPGRKAVL